MILVGDHLGWAVYGPEGLESPYRYGLGRRLELDLFSQAKRRVAFCMLNPSTATHDTDDPTIRRCIGFARAWDFDALEVGNLFAYRATNPSALRHQPDPVGPENDGAIVEMAKRCAFVVCAWGTYGELNGRGATVLELLRRAGAGLRALSFTRGGQPSHPLYLRADLEPIPWEGRAA